MQILPQTLVEHHIMVLIELSEILEFEGYPWKPLHLYIKVTGRVKLMWGNTLVQITI